MRARLGLHACRLCAVTAPSANPQTRIESPRAGLGGVSDLEVQGSGFACAACQLALHLAYTRNVREQVIPLDSCELAWHVALVLQFLCLPSPTILQLFVYLEVIPTLAGILNRNPQRIKRAILVGSATSMQAETDRM